MNRVRLIRAAVQAGLVVGLLAVPTGQILAHSEYRSSEPADNAVLTEPPTRIEAAFTAAMKPASSLVLQGPDGAEVAEGGPLAGDDTQRTMSIENLPELEPGRYTVVWDTIALDNDPATGTFVFTVEAQPSPSPSPSPVPSPSFAPSPSPSPSLAPSIATSPSVPATPPDSSPTGGGGSDLLLPALAAVVLVAVVGGWALRRNRT